MHWEGPPPAWPIFHSHNASKLKIPAEPPSAPTHPSLLSPLQTQPTASEIWVRRDADPPIKTPRGSAPRPPAWPHFSAAQRRCQHLDFPDRQLPPTSTNQTPEPNSPNRHAHQPQRGMPDRSSHAPHLPIPPLAQAQLDPEILHIFSKTNRRIARRKFRLGIQKSGTRRQRGLPVKHDAIAKLPQRRFVRQALDKHMVGFFHMIGGREQTLIPTRLVREQKQSLRVRIQTPNRINPLRKSKLRQRSIRAAIRSELREHAVGFVEGENQRIFRRVRSCESTTPIGCRPSSTTTRSSMRWRSRI